LYLLDSICKNVGSPYTIFFGLNLYKTFTDAYTLVSEPIRRKMAELFATWKQPSANGSSLFEKEPMKKIENFLEQARKRQSDYSQPNRQSDFQAQSRHFLGSRGSLSQPDLLAQVDKLLGLTQRRSAVDPNDSDAIKQIDILNQLKVILGSQTLPENILPGIQQTLVGITDKELERLNQKEVQQPPPRDPRFSAGAPQRPQSFIPTQPAALSYQNYARSFPAPVQRSQYDKPTAPLNTFFTSEQMQQVANIMTNMNVGQQPKNYESNNSNHNNRNNGNYNGNFRNTNESGSASQFNLLSMLQGSSSNNNFNQVQVPAPFNIPINIPVQNQPPAQNPILSSSLINSLMSAGLLSNNKKGPAINPFFADIQLNSTSLSKPRPNLIRLLYEDMPKSCSTCGKRFPDTPEGLKTRDAHMDWHFRVNKKLREENWTQMRCWYLTKVDWVKYRDEEEIMSLYNADDEYHSDNDYAPVLGDGNKGSNGSGNKSNGSGTGKKSGKIDYEALQNKYVLVPIDKHLASLPCPICKEKFSSVWNDDVEDWVWKNAVEVKNRIFHATCYEETSSDLIKRILAQQDAGIALGGDHSTIKNVTPTPEVLPTKVKRKIEEAGDSDVGGVVKKEKKS